MLCCIYIYIYEGYLTDTELAQHNWCNDYTMDWILNPSMGKRFSLFKTSKVSLGPTQPSIHGYWSSLPQVTGVGHEVEHLPPSSAKVKNKWSYISTPPLCLNGINRDNVTIY